MRMELGTYGSRSLLGWTDAQKYGKYVGNLAKNMCVFNSVVIVCALKVHCKFK